MARKIKISRKWFARRLLFRTYRENWQKRMGEARITLGSICQGLPGSKALTRRGVVYLLVFLLLVTGSGIFYLAQRPGVSNTTGNPAQPGYPGMTAVAAGKADVAASDHATGETAGAGLTTAALSDTEELAVEETRSDLGSGGEEETAAVTAAESKPKEQPTTEPLSPPTTAPQGEWEFSSPPGKLVTPTAGPVTSPFGWRRHPVFGDWRHHPGVDLAARPGTPVGAALAGVVAEIYEEQILGQVIILAHGPHWETRYGHLGDIKVAIGSPIARGEIIAAVGKTGRYDAPHLHFELRRDGQALDPEEYLPCEPVPAG